MQTRHRQSVPRLHRGPWSVGDLHQLQTHPPPNPFESKTLSSLFNIHHYFLCQNLTLLSQTLPPMRKLCPNYDREDGLDTVLEVPIPEEMFSNKNANKSWQNMKSWMKPTTEKSQHAMTTVFGSRNAEIQLLLGVVGAPLIPLPIRCDHQPINGNIKDHPIVSISHYVKLCC